MKWSFKVVKIAWIDDPYQIENDKRGLVKTP